MNTPRAHALTHEIAGHLLWLDWLLGKNTRDQEPRGTPAEIRTQQVVLLRDVRAYLACAQSNVEPEPHEQDFHTRALDLEAELSETFAKEPTE